MSNEIATYSMILSKLSLGKSGTECPTKTQILAINSLIVIDNASTYGANECVKIDDIDAIRYTFRYYNHIGDPEWNVAAGGNQLFVTVESCRIDGNNRINVPFKFKQLPDWLSNSSIEVKDSADNLYYLVLTASANFSTSSRSGTVIIEQEESNLTLTYSVKQSGDSISTYGDWEVSVSANPTSVSSSGGTSTITASAKRDVYWASGDVTEETATPSLSTNLGSLSGSTLTLGENTSTSSRTATITASHEGKSATCTVSQAAYSATVEWRYKIGFANGALSNISVVCRDYHAVGQSLPFTVTFLSYKSKYVDGVEDTSTRQYLDFSISSSQTWLTATKTTSSNANQGKFAIVVSENGSTSNRTGTITVTQSESQETITCDTTQVGSDAFVASYFVKFRGSTTYPSEINFGLVTAPTSKEFEVKSSFEIYTIASEYNSYNYQFGTVRNIYDVNNFMGFMDDSWFNATYEVGGGSHQYDLLTINAPASDGRNRAVPIYIAQSEFTEVSDWKYREITNSPISDQIMVKQSGLIIS